MNYLITFFWTPVKYDQLPSSGTCAAQRAFEPFASELRRKGIPIPMAARWSCPAQDGDDGEYDVTAEISCGLALPDLKILLEEHLIPEFADRMEIKEIANREIEDAPDGLLNSYGFGLN
jgi:hypothetical protein